MDSKWMANGWQFDGKSEKEKKILKKGSPIFIYTLNLIILFDFILFIVPVSIQVA